MGPPSVPQQRIEQQQRPNAPSSQFFDFPQQFDPLDDFRAQNNQKIGPTIVQPNFPPQTNVAGPNERHWHHEEHDDSEEHHDEYYPQGYNNYENGTL